MRETRNTISSRRPRIVVADDSTVAREGIAAIIRDLPYALCGLATDQRTMSELVQQHQPDLLLIEPFLGNRDGIFLIKELAARFPRTRILAVSRQPEEIYAERALRAGASGYWMKSGTREELIRAIETVLADELYVSPRVALRAVHKVVEHRATHPNAGDLTDRELHVFALIGAGFGTSRIAKELGISPRTVETYYEHIKLKLRYPDANALHKGAREWSELSHHKWVRENPDSWVRERALKISGGTPIGEPTQGANLVPDQIGKGGFLPRARLTGKLNRGGGMQFSPFRKSKNNCMKEKTMKMKTLLGLMVGAVLAVSAGAVWAAPDLVPGPIGSTAQWSVQFFLEPNHAPAATQCIVFRKTGGVVGEPNSGTWFSPSFAGWRGQWIQEGDHVRWYGSTSGSLGTAEFGALTNANLGTGEFAHFTTPLGSTSSAGSWTLVRRACASDSVTAPGMTGAGDPAQAQ